MDDADSINMGEPDLPGEAQAPVPGANEQEALEGEVFRPRERPEQAIEHDSEPEAYGGVHGDNAGGNAGAGQRESVERGLAQYVFLREEREREVRLTFRDASPSDIARTFRSAGAQLITLSAERASSPSSPISSPTAPQDDLAADSDEPREVNDAASHSKHPANRQRSAKAAPPTGEVLLRYFYALGEVVYTVSIASPTGVAASISGTYPLAARSERELTDRLAVIFI